MRLTVVESCGSPPRPDGAALAATLAARAGLDVTLICDSAGEDLMSLLVESGVTVVDLGLTDDGGAADGCGPRVADALADADAVLVSDHGRGVAARPRVRRALKQVRVPVVWDPYASGSAPIVGTTLMTLSLEEAVAATGCHDPEAAARLLKRQWYAVAVCVTSPARGALLVSGDDRALRVVSPRVVDDRCGARACFAATAAGRLAAGALPSEAVIAAVEATSAFAGAE